MYSSRPEREERGGCPRRAGATGIHAFTTLCRRSALLGVGVLMTTATPSAAAARDQQAPRSLSASQIAKRLGLDTPVLVSTWPAGFPKTLDWSADQIVAAPNGGVALRIALAPEGAHRRYLGAEFQTPKQSMVWGRVVWNAQLPKSPSGTVAAMFLYKDPFDVRGDRELDLEYVPGDPKTNYPLGTMQMTLHMTAQDGGPRESTSYKINVPIRCVESTCDWAIEAQPDRVIFQLQERPEDGWATIAEYSYRQGWDLQAGDRWGGMLSTAQNRFSDPKIWSERPMDAFASYWMADDRLGWLGPLDETAIESGAHPFVLHAMRSIPFDTLPGLEPADWSLTSDAQISIRAIPASALTATGIEYRRESGDWASLGPASPGRYAPDPPLTPGARVQLRLVAHGPAFAASHYQVVSRPSDAKTLGGSG